MKKNEGFSLVELVIVIAIMAVLAGAIAPALIKYIDNARGAKCIECMKNFQTEFQTEYANRAYSQGLYGEDLVDAVATYLQLDLASNEIVGLCPYDEHVTFEIDDEGRVLTLRCDKHGVVVGSSAQNDPEEDD